MPDRAEPSIAAPSRDGIVHFWDLFIAFFGGNAAGALLGIAAGIVVLVVALLHGFQPTQENVSAAVQTSYPLLQAFLAAGEIGFLGGVWLVAHWRFERPLAHYFGPAGAATVALAALSGVALSVLANGGNDLIERARLIPFHETSTDRLMVPHTLWQFLPAVLTVAILAPFVEEFFFRGLFFSWLRRSRGIWTATLVTAVVFALAHGHPLLHPGAEGWLYTVQLFVAGVVLAQWAARTGSLRTSFATHAAFNATALLLPALLP